MRKLQSWRRVARWQRYQQFLHGYCDRQVRTLGEPSCTNTPSSGDAHVFRNGEGGQRYVSTVRVHEKAEFGWWNETAQRSKACLEA
jgi:hypothetical protein